MLKWAFKVLAAACAWISGKCSCHWLGGIQWAGKNKGLPNKETPAQVCFASAIARVVVKLLTRGAQRKARIEKEHMDALRSNLDDD